MLQTGTCIWFNSSEICFGFLTIKMAGLGIACSGEDGGVIGYEFN
jgi:hypothetical protein